MRKRIQQLADGTFEYARPLLSFSAEKVEIEVLEGRDSTGDFIITSANHVPMRGAVYASSPRMECLTPQFEGEEVRIRFQFHSNGLVEGDIQKGEFYILCNQCEYNLSFVVSVTRMYADSSIGRIKSLSDFTRLSRANFDEAYRLFYTQNFKNILKAGRGPEALLYEGLCEGAASGQKVDEFLAASGKKRPVEITIDREEAEFYKVTGSRKETVSLRRNQWGYVQIKVSSDAVFLAPGKTELTEADFLGSACIYEYYINHEAMHAGKNFGRLLFTMPGRKLTVTVCASKGGPKEQNRPSARREIKEGKQRLLRLYIDYRLKRLVTGAWANESVRILDHLMALSMEEPIYQLMKAQAFLVNSQKQEAEWILDQFKREFTDHFSPVYGYYLYLCTLMEREPAYVDRLTEEIEEIFHRNPRSSLLFWILLFVREDYCRDGAKRLKAIERWVSERSRSPYFYLEAFYLISQEPYLLGRMGKFMTEVLNWSIRHGALTADIAIQVLENVPELRGFEPVVYRILSACYQVYPEDEMLSAVIRYLIKGQRFQTEYHRWYELGIEHELRITGLYEAYLTSLDSRRVGRVPKMIQMYFRYQSSLSYQQLAVLFVNIIAGKTEQPEVYDKYRRTIEPFAVKQLEAGHIDENLAVIYQEFLGAEALNRELAQKLAAVLFTHRLSCANQSMARAFIYEKQLALPLEVTFYNGTAYFQSYTDDYAVILEDIYGNRFADASLWQDERLMNQEAYIDKCLMLAPDELSYILYRFRQIRASEELTEPDSIYFSIILKSERVSVDYKAELLPKILKYLEQNDPDGRLKEYLDRIDAGILWKEDRRYVVELLIKCHMYERAFQITEAYGYDGLSGRSKAALAGYAIEKCGKEEDDFVLGLVETAFFEGEYYGVMLEYLCRHYNGATKKMAELWRAAEAFGTDTSELEERLITQMLYTTDYIAEAEQIYKSYCAHGGSELVRMAYLSYFANAYLVHDTVVPSHVFIQLGERFLKGQQFNAACGLGLLKYLAAQRQLTESQERIADGLLKEYTGRNLYFAFYKQLGGRLMQKYHLYDKYFLEYHSIPGAKVFLYYRMEGMEYLREELRERYAGIFVKELILFFGEEVQYYITEYDGTKEHVMESNCISNHDILDADTPGRYAMLEEILNYRTLNEEGRLLQAVKNYYSMHRVTEELFHLL